jgi:hypothetical protein
MLLRLQLKHWCCLRSHGAAAELGNVNFPTTQSSLVTHTSSSIVLVAWLFSIMVLLLFPSLALISNQVLY